MRQKLFLSAALIGLAIGPALAQTSGTGTTGAGSPSTSPPATSSPSMSQSSPSGTTGSSSQLAAVPSDAIMGSRLTDMKVRGTGSDDDIGEIDDVVLSQDGKIHQVIVQTGGVLGLGGKKVAVPWDQVRLDTSNRVATISMSQDQLKNMPAFEEPGRDRNRDRSTAPARSGGTGGTMGTGGAGGSTTGTTR